MTKIKHFNPMALREKYGIGTKSNDSNSSFWMDDTYGRRTSIFDGWDDEDKDDAKYWFTRNKIDRITKVHDYLDNLDAVGKVISFASIVRVAEDLNEGKKLQGLEMGVLYTKIPDYSSKCIQNKNHPKSKCIRN